MKKIFLIIAVALTALSVFACSKDEKSGNSQLANPFIDCEDIAEAEETAGFTVNVPTEIGGYDLTAIRAIETEMIELIWENQEGEIVIRISSAEGDVSGDYNTYPENETLDLGELEVKVRGNGSRVNAALWHSGGYTYAVVISNDGMEREDLVKLIRSIG